MIWRNIFFVRVNLSNFHTVTVLQFYDEFFVKLWQWCCHLKPFWRQNSKFLFFFLGKPSFFVLLDYKSWHQKFLITECRKCPLFGKVNWRKKGLSAFIDFLAAFLLRRAFQFCSSIWRNFWGPKYVNEGF